MLKLQANQDRELEPYFRDGKPALCSSAGEKEKEQFMQKLSRIHNLSTLTHRSGLTSHFGASLKGRGTECNLS